MGSILKQLSMIGNFSERFMKLDEFIRRLEDELRKIDGFKRELPLCMVLLNDAIMAVKEELKKCSKLKPEPILEEFMPLKKSCNEDEDKDNKKVEIRKESDKSEKMNWLSSVQLWSSNSSISDHIPKFDLSNNIKQSLKPESRKKIEEEVNHVPNRVELKVPFLAFNGNKSFQIPALRKEEKDELPVLPLSLQTPGIRHLREESSGLSSSNDQSSVLSGTHLPPHQQAASRKQRRCWSPELHRRFVDALQQLGGNQVATPKQIRELMQVDGLTNDEVKSHLQKYRLHTRKTSPTSAHGLGGLWPGQAQDQYTESSKQSNSQSGSPQGPLQFGGPSRGTSMTGGDSLEDEDEEKSESHSWRSHLHLSEKNHV